MMAYYSLKIPLWLCSTSKALDYCRALFLVYLTLYSFCLFAGELTNYRLAADDRVSITVFGEPDLSLEKVRIATNGTISIPLIGQIKVTGLTASQVEKKVAALLADGYLKKPGVTVSIAEYRLFYITGEVKNPGGYGYRDGLTVHKAVSLAGGFSERANKNKISITHEDSNDEVEGVKLNDQVRPGDVINVKESFF
jgi:polysaccharide export outer membrane protein